MGCTQAHAQVHTMRANMHVCDKFHSVLKDMGAQKDRLSGKPARKEREFHDTMAYLRTLHPDVPTANTYVSARESTKECNLADYHSGLAYVSTNSPLRSQGLVAPVGKRAWEASEVSTCLSATSEEEDGIMSV